MSKVINFNKGFLPCAILSIVLIAFGVAGYFIRGINYGLDFKPGIMETVTIEKDGVTVEKVEKALESTEGVSVKSVETGFQIRLGASDDESRTDEVVQKEIKDLLEAEFGEGTVTETSMEKISPSFSASLVQKSIIVVVLTIVLIWVYAAFRFHWDFALGSIFALIHDTLIMFTFIIWTQMEFTTTVLAAVLTIVGYSINATVVILDRIRFNLNTRKVSKFSELINISLSDTLSRSVITTLTTLFAVVALYIFTTGSIKDFALAMVVGLISGAYSSIFISSGIISAIRKNWKPEYGIHHSEKSMKKGVLNTSNGVQV